ncbi:hypothetical protein SEVIR_2G038600v4 [Setaria viridis]|uniref:Uncharacterized protein n=2 Tax=Setaria TaxID=4554 RepID=K3ZY24_SETIT|nr:uncharacterized protein LOC101762764 [Setaria italica]XP_034579535.1 uncharacterized protein LOC117843079 [Setaria viridis]RCV09493.1 hypothetical protein SETIT_2G033800v2 [Setaria italica]TKW30456.1 hypothetical protein SEVIR_2G038600v2 [Setaria viridis]
MALRFLSSDVRVDLDLRDSPPADSPPPTSQGGSSNGAKAGVARKMKEVDHLLAKLEKEGVEIDGKIASVIDDGIARIKAEAARENINEQEGIGKVLLLAIASVALGFIMGVDWFEDAILEELAKSRRS